MTRAENSIALGALAVVTAGSLYGDSFGQIGRWVSGGLTAVVGYAAWLVPLWMADATVRTFLGRPWSVLRAMRWTGMLVLCALSLSLLAGLPGGWVGATLAAVLTTAIDVGAVMLVMGTWVVLLLRVLGRDRVETISQRVVHASQVAIVHRPRLMRSSGPMFAPVIDTVGESMAPLPIPVPAPAPPAPEPGPRPQPQQPPARALPRKPSKWDLPDVGLLQEPSRAQIDGSHRAEVADNLGKRLLHFGLRATVAPSRQQGAVVSRYEITPAAGQGIKPIMAHATDLEAAYKGLRFCNLHGSGKLGVEIPVPAEHRAKIALRTVLDSPAWTESDAALPLALGVTASGDPVVIDLAACPHLLVAGATGSGKSVGIYGMLASLLLRNSPAELQLLLIDPKVVELARFRGLPHLIAPPITEQGEAVERLQWACEEMDRRYRQFVDADANDLDSYNESVSASERLPRIVIVIDEYADLSSVAKDAVEAPVIRIAQKARAAGIHMILATQRPSVEVVTGAIKANFPARIAYKTAQRQDSTTIIGNTGAYSLLGNGDSLCLIPQLAIDVTRVHGAYIDKDEVRAVVQAWTSQTNGERKPEPPRVEKPVIVEPEERPAPRQLPAPADDLFSKAVEVARSKGHVSARLLVEELHCGFGKAKKLFARMHEQNLIKPGGPNNTHTFCGEPQ